MDRARARQALCRLDLGRMRIHGAGRIDRDLRSPLPPLPQAGRGDCGATGRGERSDSYRRRCAGRQRMSRALLGPVLLFVELISVSVPSPAFAAEAVPAPGNPALEARVTRVTEELRCLVCQNQTIADSNADLAKDLRREVRQMLEQGKSEKEVREFMVARYGDFILYRPPLRASTLILWIGPFALLALAVWVHRRIVRSRAATSAPLSDEEQQRLQVLLGADSSSRRG